MRLSTFLNLGSPVGQISQYGLPDYYGWRKEPTGRKSRGYPEPWVAQLASAAAAAAAAVAAAVAAAFPLLCLLCSVFLILFCFCLRCLVVCLFIAFLI